VRITMDTLERICGALGKSARAAEISEAGSGSGMYDMERLSGGIKLEAFLEWWLMEDVFEQMGSVLGKEFEVCNMLERSTLSSCRYQVGGSVELPGVFKFFEDKKKELGISEYSVGQTTLEQIFNQFAGGSNNPEVGEAAGGGGE